MLRGALSVPHFVNADTIAQGLAAYAPETAAIQAGRVMLARLRELASARVSFAFETTLASRSFAPWLEGLAVDGYRFHLVFLWLPSAELAIARVANRVRLGGHGVPEEVIRRRYSARIHSFHQLYQPIATIWRVYDNSQRGAMRLLATGGGDRLSVCDPLRWAQFERQKGK